MIPEIKDHTLLMVGIDNKIILLIGGTVLGHHPPQHIQYIPLFDPEVLLLHEPLLHREPNPARVITHYELIPAESFDHCDDHVLFEQDLSGALSAVEHADLWDFVVLVVADVVVPAAFYVVQTGEHDLEVGA